jgi:N-hydroxyarylamine O-acetyltransferase
LNVPAYLERLHYRGSRDAGAATLRELQLAHLIAVPFENLDIHLDRPIVLDEAAFFEKIVGRRRGGFCYELNGLFAALLRALGFGVTLLSARVAREDDFSAEFAHLTLRVELPGGGPRYLADVGFGDSFREPLSFGEPGTQVASEFDDGYAYRLAHDGEEVTVLRREEGGPWQPQYVFSMIPRRLEEFTAMCHFQQTSSESHFTQRRICSRATPEGRITLSDLRFITTEHRIRNERTLSGEEEWKALLSAQFGIELESG